MTSRGLYFEDLEVGNTYKTGARTVTGADIVNFACLSGDFNEVHANWEYARTTAFGKPVAHGPLIYSIAAGLVYASGINEGTLLALLEITDWKIEAAVFDGDTIHLEQEVVDSRLTSSGNKGVVTFDRRIINQRDEHVQRMRGTYLYRTRQHSS